MSKGHKQRAWTKGMNRGHEQRAWTRGTGSVIEEWPCGGRWRGRSSRWEMFLSSRDSRSGRKTSWRWCRGTDAECSWRHCETSSSCTWRSRMQQNYNNNNNNNEQQWLIATPKKQPHSLSLIRRKQSLAITHKKLEYIGLWPTAAVHCFLPRLNSLVLVASIVRVTRNKCEKNSQTLLSWNKNPNIFTRRKKVQFQALVTGA